MFAVSILMLTFNSFVKSVRAQFVIESISEGKKDVTWLTLLDEVLQARMNKDPTDVEPVIWKAFMLYAFVLVPCIQGW